MLSSSLGVVANQITAMTAAEKASSEHETLRFLETQRWAVLHDKLFEEEMSGRLSIARAQHEVFLSTANKYIGLLFRSAETAAAAVEALSFGTAQYTPYRMTRARSAGSPGSSSGPRNRMLVCSTSNTGGPTLVTKVEIDGAAQQRRAAVATRRLEYEREQLERSVDKFERNEDRRRQSYLKRKASLMEKAAPVPKAGLDRSTFVALSEREELAEREQIREKHDLLEQKRRATLLKNQAAAGAKRHLDYLANERVRAAQRAVHEDACAAALHVHHVSLKSDRFRQTVDAEASLLHQRRQRANADFAGTLQSETQKATAAARKCEHEANALHSRTAADSMAVEITWPSELNPPPSSKRTKTIGGETYARLCGFKHDFITKESTDVSVADIAAVRRVPPVAWSLLHAVDPTAAYLTLQHAQAHVLRGPTAVKWS